MGIGVDPERHVGRRADLQGYARVDDPAQEIGVLAAAHAVADPRRSQVVDDLAHVLGPQELAAVGDGGQPGFAGDAEGRRPLRGRSPAFVVRQPEADDVARPVPGVAGRQARQRARLERVADAGGGDDDGDLDSGRGVGRLRLVEDDLERRGDPSEEGRVGRRVDLDLQAPRALRGVVLGGLADDRAHALLVAHDLAGGVVGALEAEPPALIRRHVEGAVVRQPFGQAHPLPFCQTFEGGHAHRPREMQMEVCLGEQVEIAHGSIFPHAASGRRDAKVSG